MNASASSAVVYMPERHSLEDRFLAYLAENPGEVVTRVDVAAMFGVNRNQVATLLQPSLDVSFLATSNDGGPAYKAGPKFSAWVAQAGKASRVPAPAPAPAPAAAAPKPKPATAKQIRGSTRLPALDVAAFEVQEDVPLPKPQHSLKGYTKYDALFDKLTKVGSCIPGISRSYYAALCKAAPVYTKRTKVKLSVRHIDPHTCGVWRLA